MSNSIANQKINLLAIAITGIITSGYTFAQDASPEDEKLETITIVGRTTNTEITPLELEKQQANDLADVFRHIPSVTVGGSLGFAQKVYVRGMEDTLLNVTVDGAPQTGTLFHHVGRLNIEPELLQKVEVQAGAGEATSGSGAIGGAIRFKTKSADDLLRGDRSVGMVLKANHFSNNGTKGSATIYGKLADSIGVLASYTAIERDNMEDGDGEEIIGTATDQSLAFVKLDGNFSENQKLTLSYELREEDGEVGQRPNWPVQVGDPLYPLEGERETIIANYSAALSPLVDLEATLYNTESRLTQDGRFGLYTGNTQSSGFDIRNSSRFGNFSMTYGVEHRTDTVDAGPANEETLQLYVTEGWETYLEEEGKVTGVYLQNHWQITEPLLLSFGLRYDSYELEQLNYNTEIDSSDVSPNIGLSYALTDEVKLLVGHARASRGKEVGDSFTLAEAGIDPELESEKVENNEVGIEYAGDVVSVEAAVFQSTIDDVIYDQQGRGTYYENIGEIDTTGFEISTAISLEKWYFASSLSIVDTEINGEVIEGYEHNGLGTSRGDTLNLEASYVFSENWEAGWYYTFVRKLENIEVLHRSVEIGWIDQTQYITKPSYDLHDIFVRWTPLGDDTLSFDFTVQNLLNEQYLDHSSVSDYSHIPDWEIISGVPEAGRDVRLTASYKF